MEITGNTIFISGGSAGIGLEIAKQFSAQGNKVIINGRTPQRLLDALSQLDNAEAIQGDLSVESERVRIAEELFQHHPDINVIINNAGAAVSHSLREGGNNYKAAQDEINTNYTAIIHFTELLLPYLLKTEREAAIVNVTSIIAWMILPSTPIPTYPASKAALHYYTQALRQSLEETNVNVFELIPPLTDTEFSVEINGASGIPPKEVADELLLAFQQNTLDVPVGQSKFVYSLIQEAIRKLNL